MFNRKETKSQSIPHYAIIFFCILCFGISQASELPRSLLPEPLVITKSETPLTPEIKTSLIERDGNIVKVWIFFTDKSVFTESEFATKASTLTIEPRALKRRAKVGRDEIVFADLPVASNYLSAIEQLGGKLRRVSRWLNAASYNLPADQLDAVAGLSFVLKIKPIALYKGSPMPEESSRIEQPPEMSLGIDAIDYGIATAQINQINVPPVHDKGYNGAGVTLAIFDTGYRKDHEAFAAHYAAGRVLAEWDFIFDDGNVANEGADWSSQWNHGTYIWSTSGGCLPGQMMGPAYGSNFILCKTEDIRSETQVEEDNWVAALEWVDSLGADVVTSSLGYMGWDDGSGYVAADLDGLTAVTSIAASMAADMGILVCNSAGNSGSAPQTLGAPADAFDILTIGAVDVNGSLASFSSRGPTADGRTKPEVVARGVSTACASTSTDASYTSASGTSLSTPLVAGAACLLIEARPSFTPRHIRTALMETSNNASTPNNDYGWGLIDLDAALSWGAHFLADITVGNAPATIQFTDSSSVSPLSWSWNFGDDNTSSMQNPSHLYNEPGAYDVSLSIETDSMGTITNVQQGFIILLADTLAFTSTLATPGSQVIMSINMRNSQEVSQMTIPFTFDDSPFITFDSASLGNRTASFERFQLVSYVPTSNKYAYVLEADDGGGTPPLAPGTGEVMQLHFSVSSFAPNGTTIDVDTASTATPLQVISTYITYAPAITAGTITAAGIMRGDVNGDDVIDISDLVYLVDYMFNEGPPPVSADAGNINGIGGIDISDLVYLVDYMFNEGPPPPA